MTTTTAVPRTNGSAVDLAPPENQTLVEKLRGLVMGAANEDARELVARIQYLERPSLERIADEFPWLQVPYRDSSFSSANGGTDAMKAILMEKLSAALATELAPAAADTTPEAPASEGAGSADNGADARPKAARRRGAEKDRQHRGHPKGAHAVAQARPSLTALPPGHQRVIQALKEQRAGADESTRGLLDAMIQAAERNDRVALEAIRTQVDTNTAIMQMFGMLWAALEDTQTRNATLLMEAAAGFHPRASFLAGRSRFRDSVAQIREHRASADPDMAVEPEHDTSSEPGN